ncbi:cytochrome oxidase putative small subunit CydP [Sutterella wadsworthensis]|uniref:cytochrome oxidase putative small subunit CydP n=1 Tax=Sutterella wadsworthensis TaxID=40545 RepID=UPI00266CE845|nr:cytochrome oxidase putative small subunit CydP [Sutterella wadsworthensis]
MEPRPASKRRPRLIVEIALVIACKLCIIFCLWWLFFSPEHRTTVTSDKMGDAIFSSAPSEVQTPTAKR